MSKYDRCGKINVRVLLIVILVVVALGMSLFAARQLRRSILSKKDLAAGQAAYEKKDWQAAYRHFREYLGRNPDDIEILKKYAHARLSVRPLDSGNVAGAISAYRRVLQLDPRDETAYEKLAMLYIGIGNSSELAYIARTKLEQFPDDLDAPLWLADALIRMDKMQEARQSLAELMNKLDALGGKHPEYVRACIRMSGIADANDLPGAQTEALGWLDKAVEYMPESVEALVYRARFYREKSQEPGKTEQDIERDWGVTPEEMMAAARKDLEAADAIGTDNPRTRSFLCSEWIAHGDFERAAAELKAVENLSEDALQEYFFDSQDWAVTKFLLASELAIRTKAAAEGAALADKALQQLTEKRHRVRVLPSAIGLYIADGNAATARKCLDEYIDMTYTQEGSAESEARLAYLKALVARAENKAYAVIDILQPLAVSATTSYQAQVWRLLAEAYSRTDQTRRAVGALVKYLRLRPRDPEMTLQLAKEYLKLRDWNRAFETARLAEPLNPTDIIIRLLRIEASIYLAAEQSYTVNKKQLDKLSAELATLRQEHPERVDIRILQAIIAVYLEQPEVAERELKLAIEQCSEPLRAEMQLVRHYYRTKRPDEAMQVCKAACERHPTVAEPWLSLSGLYVARGDYDTGRSCLREGLEKTGDKWEKRSLTMRLALLEILYADRATGIKLLSDLAEQDRQEIRARTLLLGIREVQQDKAMTEKLVQELKEAEGQSGLSWRLNQAALWLSSEDWRSRQQDITDLLRYCIDADPEWSAPVLLLVEMYEKLEDPVRVEDTCRQALARNPSATDVADRLVTLLERQGRFTDAQQVLQQIEVNERVASDWSVRMALNAGDFSRAINELKLRAANDDRDANSRILLARLIYWQTRDAEQAFAYLKEAEDITSNSMALTAARVAIMRAEGMGAQTRELLDRYVADNNDFGAYMMRATYLANEGEFELAEKDYRKLTTFEARAATGYELLSSFYARNGKLDEAAAALEEAIGAYPENLRLKRMLMKTLFLRGKAQDRERAGAMLASLEKRLPQDPELMKLRAVQMLDESRTQETLDAAGALLEKAIKFEPTAVDAQLLLISIKMQQKNYEAARDTAIRALGSNPKNLALLTARGRAELALHNTTLAAELANLVLEKDPNDTNARDLLLSTALVSKDKNLLRQAMSLLEPGTTAELSDDSLLLWRARLAASLKQPETAIPALEQYCRTKEGSKSIIAIITLADLYRLNGEMEKAEQQLSLAEKLDPNDQAVVHSRFLLLVAQKRFDELPGISAKYLAAKNQNPTILTAAAMVLSASDSMELKKESLKLYERALELAPADLSARFGLASAAYRAGDFERAERTYRQLLVDYPRDVRVLNDLAWILQEQFGRYDEALELANKGLDIEPENLHLLDTRGTILSNIAGRLDDARKDFTQLAELTPPGTSQRAKALLQLGRVCAKMNDLLQAKQHLENALKIDQELGVFTAEEKLEITEIIQM